jgi:hypothetical protein
MKQATLWVVIAGFAVSAWAHVYGENEPIHHALYAKHADKSVVAAVISEARGLEDEGGATFVGTLVVRVEGVEVRRSALAATLYATEDDASAVAIGQDLGSFFEKGAGGSCLPHPEAYCGPMSRLLRTYFFLDPRSRTWGSRWDEEEAAKHARLTRAVTAHAALSPSAVMVLERIP